MIKRTEEENGILKEYDENDNLIHSKNSNGYEEWYEYDSDNNCIHHKDSKGYEFWKKYKGGKLVGYKDTLGSEYRDTSIIPEGTDSKSNNNDN